MNEQAASPAIPTLSAARPGLDGPPAGLAPVLRGGNPGVLCPAGLPPPAAARRAPQGLPPGAGLRGALRPARAHHLPVAAPSPLVPLTSVLACVGWERGTLVETFTLTRLRSSGRSTALRAGRCRWELVQPCLADCRLGVWGGFAHLCMSCWFPPRPSCCCEASGPAGSSHADGVMQTMCRGCHLTIFLQLAPRPALPPTSCPSGPQPLSRSGSGAIPVPASASDAGCTLAASPQKALGTLVSSMQRNESPLSWLPTASVLHAGRGRPCWALWACHWLCALRLAWWP